MLLLLMARNLLRRWWAIPTVAGVLIAAGAYVLVITANPGFRQVTGAVSTYNQARTGGYYVRLEGDGFGTYTLAGDQTGAPRHLVPGSQVAMTVVNGTNDVVALHGSDVSGGGLFGTGSQVVVVNWTSPYLYSPQDYGADHRPLGFVLAGFGLLLLAVFVYFRFLYEPPSAETVSREAERLAGVDYGPRSAEVSALLRHLAALPDTDWQLLGDACFRVRFTGGEAPPVAALQAAARASGRNSAAGRARAAAELILRQHPAVPDSGGMDLRPVMTEPVGRAAAALALRDVLEPADFNRLFGSVGRFVPVSALSNAPDPATIVALPEASAPA